ncbi:MAG: hypothetical protein ACE5GW_06805, partial [Planctomycetota bacterium]
MQGEAPEPADAPSSPPRWRRLLFWLIVAFGGLLLVILSVVAVWLLTVGRDIPQVDDEDLLLERESIPEKENGYTFLERACETLCIREDFSRNCWLLDPSPDELEESQRKKARELRSSGWAETVLGENREALALVEEVLRCSKMQAALTLDAPLMEVMRLASLLLLRSRHQARQGIDAQSLEDIVNLLGLGRLHRGGNGTLISSLIAQELVEAAHDELREAVQAPFPVGTDRPAAHAERVDALAQQGQQRRHDEQRA